MKVINDGSIWVTKYGTLALIIRYDGINNNNEKEYKVNCLGRTRLQASELDKKVCE